MNKDSDLFEWKSAGKCCVDGDFASFQQTHQKNASGGSRCAPIAMLKKRKFEGRSARRKPRHCRGAVYFTGYLSICAGVAPRTRLLKATGPPINRTNSTLFFSIKLLHDLILAELYVIFVCLYLFLENLRIFGKSGHMVQSPTSLPKKDVLTVVSNTDP